MKLSKKKKNYRFPEHFRIHEQLIITSKNKKYHYFTGARGKLKKIKFFAIDGRQKKARCILTFKPNISDKDVGEPK